MDNKYNLPLKYDDINIYERKHVRSQYIKEQSGLCFFCQSDLYIDPPESVKRPIDWSLFPKGFMNYPIHLQHDHTTGMTEGAVHALCNAIMWQYLGK